MNRRQFSALAASAAQQAQNPGPPERDVLERRPYGPLAVGTKAQLFVERTVVSTSERVWFTMHQAEKHPKNPLIVADQEWEGWRVKPYGNTIFDAEEKLFKMWYDSEPGLEYFPGNSNYSSYAISHDGVAWEKPAIGTIESTKLGLRHNVVMGAQLPCVTKDHAEADPSRRYKSICLIRDAVRTKVNEYHTMVSLDGLHWKKFSSQPIAPETDVITGYFDEGRKLWVAFPKIHVVVGNHRRRCFHLITSPDFVHWSSPRLVFAPDLHDDASSLSRIEKVRPMLNDPDEPRNSTGSASMWRRVVRSHSRGCSR